MIGALFVVGWVGALLMGALSHPMIYAWAFRRQRQSADHD